jgi:ABC-type multidrug transport system fused ATPase/permease subunit
MEGLEWNIDTVASVIDVAVAPVFLLAGISGLLMVLTSRLGRTIDRSRSLQSTEAEVRSPRQRQALQREMANLLRRMHLNHVAISMAVLSAILVCLVVVTLFLGSLLQLNVSSVIAGLFIVCMIILSLAFISFLLEVLVAIRVLRASLIHVTSFRHEETDSSAEGKL